MGKKKKPNNLSKQTANKKSLTPWQKANQKYLAEHGKEGGKNENVDQKEAFLRPIDQIEQTDDKIKVSKSPEKEVTKPFEKIKQFKTGSPYNGSFLNRLPNLTNQRNKVLYRRLVFIITILSIPLIFLIYYVSPYSRLQKISILGNEAIPSQTVIKDTHLLIGGNVWKQYWHKNQYIETLKKKQPRIETAQLNFKSINTFQLNIKEYKEIALVMKNDQYFPVLENGKVLDEKADNPTKNLPILENFTDYNKINSLIKEYSKLSSELQKAISEIKYTPKDNNKNLIQLNMNDGNRVIVNIQNLASQMNYYSQVAKEMTEKGVIDMEVGIFSYPYTDSNEKSKQTIQTSAANNQSEQQEVSRNQTDNLSDSSTSNEEDRVNNSSESSQKEDQSSSSTSVLTGN
ncbi:cell division protein FtsQ/DivIB [Enterococcus ratti]|uniref:cell division protein FtsQ/DivIB n=1 Tax=Enterococcus ratti TaxID=150033 RepID=UPI0035178A31